MKRKNKLSLEGKGRDIFFDDDKTVSQQDDLLINHQSTKNTYKQQRLKRVTFYVDPDLHKRIKIDSANLDMKISELVNKILNEYFDKQDDKETG